MSHRLVQQQDWQPEQPALQSLNCASPLRLHLQFASFHSKVLQTLAIAQLNASHNLMSLREIRYDEQRVGTLPVAAQAWKFWQLAQAVAHK